MDKYLLKRQACEQRFLFDSDKRKNCGIVCGIDEAGRGPFVGAVYAAAVIFPEGVFIDGLNDSKQLSEKNRELLFDKITEAAQAYCVAFATVDEIEEHNILGATFLAMNRAYAGLNINADIALVDGNRIPPLDCYVETVVKGDSVSASIAAASILAKVSRDRYMAELDKQYPEFHWLKNKGYGTAEHIEALRKYGVTPVHRRSFLKKLEAKYGAFGEYRG